MYEWIDLAMSVETLTMLPRGPEVGCWLGLVVRGEVQLRGDADVRAFVVGELFHGRPGRPLTLKSAGDAAILMVYLPCKDVLVDIPAASSIWQRGAIGATRGTGQALLALMQMLMAARVAMSKGEFRALEISIAACFSADLHAAPDVSASTNVATDLAIEKGSTWHHMLQNEVKIQNLKRDFSRGRKHLLQRAYDMIDARLQDPELSLTGCAADLAISPRYLQKLLGENGEAFNSYVRRRRLEGAYEALMNPMLFRTSISEICFRWGFNDAAYFSRSFRSRYGVSPSGHREIWKNHGKRCVPVVSGRNVSAIMQSNGS